MRPRARSAHVVSGNAGDSHHNVASVTGHDEDGRNVTDDDFADVEITDVAPSIDVTKTANPITVAEPGASVEFTVDVEEHLGLDGPGDDHVPRGRPRRRRPG